jgi:hypothetical protein
MADDLDAMIAAMSLSVKAMFPLKPAVWQMRACLAS